MPPISAQAEVIDGETPANLPAGALINLYDSCQLATKGVVDPMFRSVLVQISVSTGDPTKIGYRTADPKAPGGIAYPVVEGRFYDLRKVVAKLGAAGDRVIFSAIR